LNALALWWRVIGARPRLFVGLLCGLVAVPLLPHCIKGTTQAVVAWDIGVVVYLVLSGFLFTTERMDRMAEDAAAQEEGEWTIFWLTVAVVTFSFVAIIGEFADISKDMPPHQRSQHVILVAVTLFVSWLMTHTTFAFRYAHEFYEVDDDSTAGISGGLEFPGEKQPDYLDFLYFSLVLGMTFQVSDVQIESHRLRRIALGHGILAFFFNVIIVALTINILAGLI
jgi:uncharacterized membrane protein